MKSIKKYVGIFLLALCLIGTMQAVPCKAASLNSNVNGIVKSQVLPEDTKEVKLQKLFQYTEKTYGYKRQIGFKNKKGWTKTYAQKMIKSKKEAAIILLLFMVISLKKQQDIKFVLL